MKEGLFAIAVIELCYFVFAGNEICPGKTKNIVYTGLCALICMCGVVFSVQIQAAIAILIISLLFVTFYLDRKRRVVFPALVCVLAVFLGDIIVFENGSIIEHGCHSNLLHLAGKYAAMWNAQAGYYEVKQN